LHHHAVTSGETGRLTMAASPRALNVDNEHEMDD
jgi:hypothetical protein